MFKSCKKTPIPRYKAAVSWKHVSAPPPTSIFSHHIYCRYCSLESHYISEVLGITTFDWIIPLMKLAFQCILLVVDNLMRKLSLNMIGLDS